MVAAERNRHGQTGQISLPACSRRTAGTCRRGQFLSAAKDFARAPRTRGRAPRRGRAARFAPRRTPCRGTLAGHGEEQGAPQREPALSDLGVNKSKSGERTRGGGSLSSRKGNSATLPPRRGQIEFAHGTQSLDHMLGGGEADSLL